MPDKHNKGAGFELSNYNSFFLGKPFDITQRVYGYSLDSGGLVPIREENFRAGGQTPISNLSLKYNFSSRSDNIFFVQGLFEVHVRGVNDGFFVNSSSNVENTGRPEQMMVMAVGGGIRSQNDRSDIAISGSISGGVTIMKNNTDFLNDKLEKFVMPTMLLDIRLEKDISERFSIYTESNFAYIFNNERSEIGADKSHQFKMSPVNFKEKLGVQFDVTDNIALSGAISAMAGFGAEYYAQNGSNADERITKLSPVPLALDAGVRVKF